MNLREKKGFTGIDISIAVIIILIFIPTVFGVVYNVSKVRQVVVRESTSISKAVETLEESKKLGIENVETTYPDNYETTFTDNDETAYKLQVSYERPSQYTTSGLDLVKKIIVKVTYPTGNTTKTIEMSTILKKQII